MIIVGTGCVTNCVTITAYGGGLPWILRDASAGQYGRSPLVRAPLLLLRDEEAVGSNPAAPATPTVIVGQRLWPSTC